MNERLRRLIAGLALLLCFSCVVEARQKLEGFAGINEQSIAAVDITAASISIKTFPGCSVSVFIAGTDTLASIYANESGAPKENPFIADSTTAAWSFYADNGRYDIRFYGAGITTPFAQEGVKALDAQEHFNVRNYGARGKGASDDTASIKTAVKAIETVNGGKLIFPTGVYLVSSKISLPSGIVIEGTNSNYFGNCRLQLTTPNQSIFLIGGNRRRITIRDLELKATTTKGTIGIEAAGEYPNSSFQIEFDNLSISGFDRGISAEGNGPRDQWQIENVRVHHTTIGDCNYGIYLNSQNADYWKIEDCPIGSTPNGYGIYLERSGLVNLDGTYGSGPPGAGQAPAKTFIYVGGAHSNLTIINAHCEYYTNWMEVVEPHNMLTPITVISSSIGAPLLLRANCQFVSIGNAYVADSIQTVGQATSVPIYSIGDTFSNRGVVGGDFKLQNDSRLAIRSNFTRNDFQNQTRFSSRVGVGNVDAPSDVLLNLATQNDGATHLRIGGSTVNRDAQGKLVESCPSCYYNIRRDTTPEAMADGTLGYLSFKGNQSNYTGYSFNGPIVTSGDLLPAANGTGNIGNNSRRWNQVRALTITPGDVVLTDRKSGKELYRIHEDEENIYFDDIRTGAPLMRLDRNGNLHLSGKIYQNAGRRPKHGRKPGRRARR
jgi:hypothetical protein